MVSDDRRLTEWVMSRGRAQAWFLGRNFRKFPCKKCGLFGCICQSSLFDWLESKPVMLKDRCSVCGLFLCSCSKDASGNPIPSLK